MFHDDSSINPYLQQEVLSASQIRLRWMLINKAVELCEAVGSLWKDGQDQIGDQWSLRLRDVLGELLSGVVEGNPLSKTVADFYIFTLKEMFAIESKRDVTRLGRLRDLLAYEAETWRMVMEKEAKGETASAAPIFPAPKSTIMPVQYNELGGDSSFSLEV